MSGHPAQMSGYPAYGYGMENVHLLGIDWAGGGQLTVHEKGGGISDVWGAVCVCQGHCLSIWHICYLRESSTVSGGCYFGLHS